MGVSRKLNDGDYGSTGFDLAIELDVPPGASVGEFIDQTYSRMHNKLVELVEKNM